MTYGIFYVEILVILVLTGRSEQTNLSYVISICSREGQLCNGALIRPNWILTTAQCLIVIEEHGKYEEFDTGKETRFTLMARTHSGKELKRKSSQIILHEGFELKYKLHDIALIYTKISFTLGDGIGLIELQKERMDFDNLKVTVANWGKNQSEAFRCMDGNMNALQLPVLPKTDCRKLYAESVFDKHFEESSVICVGVLGETTCNGYLGTPIVYEGKLIAIVSMHGGCHAKLPSLSTAVASYIPWIDQLYELTNRLRGGVVASGTIDDYCSAAVFASVLFYSFLVVNRIL